MSETNILKKSYDAIGEVSKLLEGDEIPEVPETFTKLGENIQYALILYALAKMHTKSNWSALASIIGLIITIMTLVIPTWTR